MSGISIYTIGLIIIYFIYINRQKIKWFACYFKQTVV